MPKIGSQNGLNGIGRLSQSACCLHKTTGLIRLLDVAWDQSIGTLVGALPTKAY
jgi:hypothetical protein